MESMLLIIGALGYVLLVLLVALRIPHSQLSEFELERRKKLGDPQAAFGGRRRAAYRDIVTVRWLVAILVGLMTVLCIHTAVPGWRGVVVMIFTGILLGLLATLGVSKRLSQRIYRHYESSVIQALHRWTKIWRMLSPPFDVPGQMSAPSSREELEHLIEESETSVSRDEVQLLKSALRFYEKTAANVMTGTTDLVTVPVDEVVGPLVVNDLHKTGHTVFPVVDRVGEYVGLFDISGFTSLRRLESPSVRDVMSSEVIHIGQDEPLDEVLKLFVDTKQTCMFVTDEEQNVVGLISLSDIVRALTGWSRHPGR